MAVTATQALDAYCNPGIKNWSIKVLIGEDASRWLALDEFKAWPALMTGKKGS